MDKARALRVAAHQVVQQALAVLHKPAVIQGDAQGDKAHDHLNVAPHRGIAAVLLPGHAGQDLLDGAGNGLLVLISGQRLGEVAARHATRVPANGCPGHDGPAVLGEFARMEHATLAVDDALGT